MNQYIYKKSYGLSNFLFLTNIEVLTNHLSNRGGRILPPFLFMIKHNDMLCEISNNLNYLLFNYIFENIVN